jgi:tetratricopeptide (TPR) repeat protein
MSSNQAETIGQRLRRLRLDRGLSQRELSAPGVSYAYISRIEAGTRQPSVKALRKLAPKLGVSTEYLETGSAIAAEQQRELELGDAELQLRLSKDSSGSGRTLSDLLSSSLEAGDFASAARARIALGMLAAQEGRHDEAVRLLEEAMETEPSPHPTTRPDVFATLGQSYALIGKPRQAVEMFERCLEQVRTEDDENVIGLVRFGIYLSYALVDAGDISRAHEVVQEAIQRADGFDDPYTQVRLHWSVARLAVLQGRPSGALENIRRAIALLEATEDTVQLGRAHLLCGFIMNTEGKTKDAGKHLELAERLLTSRHDTNDLASLRAEQAKHAALLGKGDETVKRAQEALDLLGDEDPGERGGILAAMAQGHALQGDTTRAEREFAEAIGLLEGNGRWRVAELAARSLAKLLAKANRKDDAAAMDARADRFAARAGALTEAAATK